MSHEIACDASPVPSATELVVMRMFVGALGCRSTVARTSDGGLAPTGFVANKMYEHALPEPETIGQLTGADNASHGVPVAVTIEAFGMVIGALKPEPVFTSYW